MRTLKHSEFIALVSGIPGATIIGIETVTDARALKTGNPYPNKTILKKSRGAVMVGADYQNGVNNEGMASGIAPSFKASELPYGEWLVPGKFIAHNGNVQLRTQSRPGQRRVAAMRLLAYLDTNGNKLEKTSVAPFLPEKVASKKQASFGLGPDKSAQVWVNNYKLESIRKVRVLGTTYKLVA